MKKILVALLFIVSMFFTATPAFAAGTVTKTEFSKVYYGNTRAHVQDVFNATPMASRINGTVGSTTYTLESWYNTANGQCARILYYRGGGAWHLKAKFWLTKSCYSL